MVCVGDTAKSVRHQFTRRRYLKHSAATGSKVATASTKAEVDAAAFGCPIKVPVARLDYHVRRGSVRAIGAQTTKAVQRRELTGGRNSESSEPL